MARLRYFIILTLALTMVGARDWLPRENVHRLADHLVRSYGDDKEKHLAAMVDYCEKGEEFSFYLCTLAARFAYKGDKKASKKYLEQALKQDPSAVVSANQFKQLFNEPVPFLRKDLKYYELAIEAARQKKTDKAVDYLGSAIENGFTFYEAIENHNDFRRAGVTVKMKERLSQLKKARQNPADVKELSRLGQRPNALMRVIDASYTIHRHRQQADHSKALSLYYRAEAATARGSYQAASAFLQQFVSKLETKKQPYLAAHALVFIWQHKKFKNLKRRGFFKTWFYQKAATHKISTEWLRRT